MRLEPRKCVSLNVDQRENVTCEVYCSQSLHRLYGRAQNIRKPNRCVRFTKDVVSHANIRLQNPSPGMICPGDPHQRNPNVPKFEERSQEETEWQEQRAHQAAWKQKLTGQKFISILLTFGKLVPACEITQ